MELEIIEKAGLSKAQAKTYLALLNKGALTPAEVAKETGETRTNAYAVLAKMEKIGVVKRGEGKKLKYEPSHPSSLEIIAERKRRTATKNEQTLKANMSGLLDIFYAHSEKPGVKTFTGYDGVKEVYRDIVNTGETVYLLRTEKDGEMGDFIMKYREEMGRKGVETIGLMPDTKQGRELAEDGTDERTLMRRTAMPRGDYTAPVTVMAYGRKVALVAYGETEMSMVITSPAIAEAVRQMIMLLRAKYEK